MLKNHLYKIEASRVDGSGAVFTLSLCQDDAIFKAHFPGRPIMPGACIMQIAKELVSYLLDKDVDISEVKQAKFLNVLSPTAYPQVDFVLSKRDADDASYRMTVENGSITFAKASFTIA